MRIVAPVLALLCCLPVAAATAAPIPAPDITAVGEELPRAVTFGADGAGALVTTTRAATPTASMAVVRIPSGTRQTFTTTEVLSSVAREDGGADLLVRHDGELTLRRVLPGGQLLDLWSEPTTARIGALARRAGRTLAVWPQDGRLRLITRPDGGIPSRLPSIALGVGAVRDIDAAYDAQARIVVGVTAAAGPARLSVLTLRNAGRILLARQIVAGGRGLAQVAVTPSGRTGVVVEDPGTATGDEPCAARHVRVVTRPAGALAFGVLREVAAPPADCLAARALLRGRRDDGLTVVFEAGTRAAWRASAALAPAGQGFGAPTTVAQGALAGAALATVGGSAAIRVALVRPTVPAMPTAGALSLVRAGAPELALSAGPASAPVLARDAGGGLASAWREGSTLRVVRDPTAD